MQMKLTEHNSKQRYVPDHPYRILIIGNSGSGKTNVLLNLNSQILIKYICTLKIHVNLNINF